MLVGGMRALKNMVALYSDIEDAGQLLLYKVRAMAGHEVEEDKNPCFSQSKMN